jgi:hypothetical protein
LSNRTRRSESDVLPAITLEVEPTDSGLRLMAAELTAFAKDHELPGAVGARMVSVAGDVAGALLAALEAPAVGRLQADADIGVEDAQLVLIASDHRLPDVHASLRPVLDRLGAQCDGFAAELAPNGDLQVWARFRLA